VFGNFLGGGKVEWGEMRAVNYVIPYPFGRCIVLYLYRLDKCNTFPPSTYIYLEQQKHQETTMKIRFFTNIHTVNNVRDSGAPGVNPPGSPPLALPPILSACIIVGFAAARLNCRRPFYPGRGH